MNTKQGENMEKYYSINIIFVFRQSWNIFLNEIFHTYVINKLYFYRVLNIFQN